MKNLSYCLLLMSLVAGQVFAAEQELAKITNDEDKKLTVLYVEVDDETSDAKKLIQRVYSEQGKVEIELKFSTLEVKKGVVLNKKKKREIVKLKSENFSAHNGGHAMIDTLYNGATGKRKSYEIEVLRNGDEWALAKDGEEFTRMHFVSHKVIGLGTVGIKKITMK